MVGLGVSMKLATIDIGTNTALLLISSWKNDRLVEHVNASGFVRLGEGMDASGKVSDAALARLQAVLFSHMQQIRAHQVDQIIVTGTSASRDASDAHRIHTLVRTITGTDFTILSGDEEALVTFMGASAGLTEQPEGRITVVDVGGGSTEIVQGNTSIDTESLPFKTSLNMGSVRMTERFFSKQPAVGSEIDAAQAWLRQTFASACSGAVSTTWCVGASGTARMLALIVHDVFELSEIEGTVRVPTTEVFDWSNRLLHMEYDEVLALHPAKMQGRADVLPAGVLILSEILQFVNADFLVVSPFGVRHGVAIRYFRESLL